MLISFVPNMFVVFGSSVKYCKLKLREQSIVSAYHCFQRSSCFIVSHVSVIKAMRFWPFSLCTVKGNRVHIVSLFQMERQAIR